jgi:hypothetical protein
MDTVFWDGSTAQQPVFGRCGHTSPLGSGEALEVMGEAGHRDQDARLVDADGICVAVYRMAQSTGLYQGSGMLTHQALEMLKRRTGLTKAR